MLICLFWSAPSSVSRSSRASLLSLCTAMARGVHPLLSSPLTSAPFGPTRYRIISLEHLYRMDMVRGFQDAGLDFWLISFRLNMRSKLSRLRADQTLSHQPEPGACGKDGRGCSRKSVAQRRPQFSCLGRELCQSLIYLSVGQTWWATHWRLFSILEQMPCSSSTEMIKKFFFLLFRSAVVLVRHFRPMKPSPGSLLSLNWTLQQNTFCGMKKKQAPKI